MKCKINILASKDGKEHLSILAVTAAILLLLSINVLAGDSDNSVAEDVRDRLFGFTDITGRAVVVDKNVYSDGLNTDLYKFTFAVGNLPKDNYELLLQLRREGEEEWINYGTSVPVDVVREKFLKGNNVEIKVSPILLQAVGSGTYQVRLIGATEGVSSENFKVESLPYLLVNLEEGQAEQLQPDFDISIEEIILPKKMVRYEKANFKVIVNNKGKAATKYLRIIPTVECEKGNTWSFGYLESIGADSAIELEFDRTLSYEGKCTITVDAFVEENFFTSEIISEEDNIKDTNSLTFTVGLEECAIPTIESCFEFSSDRIRIDWNGPPNGPEYELEWCSKNAENDENCVSEEVSGTYEIFPKDFFKKDESGNEVRVRVSLSNFCEPREEFSKPVTCVPLIKAEDIKVTPYTGPPGTIFTLEVNSVPDIKLDSKLSKIIEDNDYSKSLLSETQLYDDGQHNDKEANDGIYANTFDSEGFSAGPYEFSISNGFVKSVTSNIGIGSFGECKAVIPGHNNKDENRVNVVFVGYEYKNNELFKQFVRESVGGDNNFGGILTQEPFKSNPYKFNFWYIDNLGESPEPILTNDFSAFLDDTVPPKIIKDANSNSLNCGFANRYLIIMIDKKFRSFATFGGHVLVSRPTSFENYLSFYVSGIVIHEFGHSFGRLGDEYKGLGRTGYEAPNSVSDSECTAWKKFEGNGCGSPGNLDCVVSYNKNSDSVVCTNGNDCYVEIGCFKGAVSTDFYRPTFNSLMRSHDDALLAVSPRAFGEVNERQLCKKIIDETGSAGGICDEYE